MLDASPRHVGDVQQTVDAAEVDERTVVGKVLDQALDLGAFGQALEQRIAFGAGLGLDHRAAADHHVVALAVDLDDFEFKRLAFEVARVAHRTHVHQRARQKRANALQVDGKTALDLVADDPCDGVAGLAGRLEFVPCLGPFGLLAGQAGLAIAIFDRVERDVHLVSNSNFELTTGIPELLCGDHPLGLQTCVHNHRVCADCNDSPGNNAAWLHVA